MNFYDEAIEAKNAYYNQLARQQQSVRQMIKKGQLEVIESNVDLEHLYEPNINALRQSEPYFWDARIVQLLIASGQQLPDNITFDDSWLIGRAGYWWFGRSSPLIGVSEGDHKWYVYSLLWWIDGTELHITTLDILEREHNQLGAFTWRQGEMLQDAITRLQNTPMVSRASSRIDLLLDRIIIDKMKEKGYLEDEILTITQRMAEIEAELKAQGADVPSRAHLEAAIKHHEAAAQKAEEYNAGHERRVSMWKEASANALKTFACGSLWLQQKIVVTEYGKLDRHAERRLMRAEIPTTVRVVYLRSKSYVKTTPDEEKNHVDWAWQWAVRGHWRNQPTKEGVKMLWIHPFIKGPEDKPLKPSVARVFAVTR